MLSSHFIIEVKSYTHNTGCAFLTFHPFSVLHDSCLFHSLHRSSFHFEFDSISALSLVFKYMYRVKLIDFVRTKMPYYKFSNELIS